MDIALAVDQSRTGESSTDQSPEQSTQDNKRFNQGSAKRQHHGVAKPASINLLTLCSVLYQSKGKRFSLCKEGNGSKVIF